MIPVTEVSVLNEYGDESTGMTKTTRAAYDVPRQWVEKLYEVIDGKFVEPTPMGAFELLVATYLQEAILEHFARTERRGWVVPESLFLLSDSPKRQRRPDLAFVTYDRWPRSRSRPRTAAWEVIPDLAVEVISPGNTAIEIFIKLNDYFRAGVRHVWLIYPEIGFVQDFEAIDRLKVLGIDGTLDGGDVLPGFQIKLSELFSDEAAPTESDDR